MLTPAEPSGDGFDIRLVTGSTKADIYTWIPPHHDSLTEYLFDDHPSTIRYISFNWKSDLTKNNHFRRALSLAIDRQRLAEDSNCIKPLYELIPPKFPGSRGKSDMRNLGEALMEIKKVPESLLANEIVIPVFDREVPAISEAMQALGLRFRYKKTNDVRYSFKDSNEVFGPSGIAVGHMADPMQILSLFALSLNLKEISMMSE